MNNIVSLFNMPLGVEAVVKQISGGKNAQNRLKVLGIRPGAKIKKISSGFARGPIVVKVGSTQTALGFGVASKVFVEAEE
jgi:ferrous iron transport protein A